MERFVAQYVRDNPSEEGMEAANTTLAWIEFLRENGVEHAYATGSIAEVLADVNDRVSSQTQQLANSVGWSKDLIAMQLQQDSMRMEVGARLDSLERNFTRIVVVAEHLPEISDKVLEELSLEEFKGYSALFENDVYDAIDLIKCCEGRTSYGGPSEASVRKQIELASAQLGAWEAENA